MRIIYNGSIYESNFHKDIDGYFNEDFSNKLLTYSKLIAQYVNQAFVDKNNVVDSNPFLLKDLLDRYNVETPEDLINLKIGFAEGETYYYVDKYDILVFPIGIKKGFSKTDYHSISHELTHMFQFKNGTWKDEGTYTNPANKDSEFAYTNDTNEIKARLNQLITYLKSNKALVDEVKEYDFEPFVEELIEKIFKVKDFHEWRNSMTEDTLQHTYEVLYLLWKKIKTGNF